MPRNIRQVKNVQAQLRRNSKLTHDSLYQLENYVLSIKTTPDLEVVVGNSEIFDEVNRILQLKDTEIGFIMTLP